MRWPWSKPKPIKGTYGALMRAIQILCEAQEKLCTEEYTPPSPEWIFLCHAEWHLRRELNSLPSEEEKGFRRMIGAEGE